MYYSRNRINFKDVPSITTLSTFVISIPEKLLSPIMPISYNLQINRVIMHDKTPTGVYLLVLFTNGKKAWMSMTSVVQLNPIKANEYLRRYPELYPHHLKYYR